MSVTHEGVKDGVHYDGLDGDQGGGTPTSTGNTASTRLVAPELKLPAEALEVASTDQYGNPSDKSVALFYEHGCRRDGS